MAEIEHRVVTTEELIELLKEGFEVHLPDVVVPSDEILQSYNAEDCMWFQNGNLWSMVSAVDECGEDLVQCIMVDNPNHQYLCDEFIPTHNTSNIVFLKSTDDSMLDTLEKMSGKTHESHTDSKMISRDEEKVWMRNQGVISYTMSTSEKPVITYNDMAFIPERNSIVFRAGDSPIWNRNETVLPMSWRLLKANAIRQPGKTYSLQTIPTLSSALEFDVRKNQPDFQQMLQKRKEQAILVENAKKIFQDAFGYSDLQISQLDPDVYADAIMEIVNAEMHKQANVTTAEDITEHKSVGNDIARSAEDNPDQKRESERAEHDAIERQRPRYAGSRISRANLIGDSGAVPNHAWDKDFIDVWRKYRHQIITADAGRYFSMRGDDLYSNTGQQPYITMINDRAERTRTEKAARNPNSRVFNENDNLNDFGSYLVHDEFYIFLAKLEMWDFAGGIWERKMAEKLANDMR